MASVLLADLPLFFDILVAVFAWFVGLGIFLGVPFVVGQSAPWSLRWFLIRLYSNQLGRALYRFLVVVLDGGGVALAAADRDPSGTLMVKMNGFQRYYHDVADRMDYYLGYPVGIVSEEFDVVINPVDAALGRLHAEYIESDGDVLDLRTWDVSDELQAFGRLLGDHLRIPVPARAVDVKSVRSLLGNAGEPHEVEIVKEWVKLSQQGFKTPNTKQYIFLGVLALITAGVWFFAFDMRDSLGDGETVIGVGALVFDLAGVVV